VAGFSVGERVIIRYGKRQGETALILQCQPAEVYKVKTKDGAILFFSSKGLERLPVGVPQPD
jgi:hypothetical protein